MTGCAMSRARQHIQERVQKHLTSQAKLGAKWDAWGSGLGMDYQISSKVMGILDNCFVSNCGRALRTVAWS